MQALDPSHWEDASLLRPELETKRRPAVVLDVERQGAYWTVKALPLRRCIVRGANDGDVSAISVSPQCLETSASMEWPWGEIVAFGFPCAETFVCLPDQVTPFSVYVSVLHADFTLLCSTYLHQVAGHFPHQIALNFRGFSIGVFALAPPQQMSD